MNETVETFRVEQTYDEIKQAVLDAAETVLTWHSEFEPPPSDGEMKWAEKAAKRIAEQAVMHLDAADEVTDEMIDRALPVFKVRTHPQPAVRPEKWDEYDRAAVREILDAALALRDTRRATEEDR